MPTNQPKPVEVDGDCLIVPDGESLPSVCVRCGDPAAGPPRTYAFTWNPHGYRMGRGKAGSIAAVATNRRGRVRAFYCAAHQPHVLRNCVVMALLSAVLFAVAFYQHKVGRPNAVGFSAMMLSIVLIVLMLVYLAMPTVFIECRKIDDDGRLWLHLRGTRASERAAAAAAAAASFEK